MSFRRLDMLLGLLLAGSIVVPAGFTVAWPKDAPDGAIEEAKRLLPDAVHVKCGYGTAEQTMTCHVRPTAWVQFEEDRPKNFPKWLAAAETERKVIIIFIRPIEKCVGFPKGDFRFGLVLGRIVAHEMVHILRPDLGHFGNGLMQSHHSKQALLSRVQESLF
jgi:hypothetical protein